MCKAVAFMRDVITKHHPDFVASKSLRKFGVEHPELFDIEKLMDHCLSAVGGYKYVDETGRDFNDTDNSDGKTSTVNANRKILQIASVENKIGSLRVTVYNETLDETHFFYIPKKFVDEVTNFCYGKNEHKLRIVAKWNEFTDHYNRLEKFRVKDFRTLATMTDRKFKLEGNV